MLSPTLFRLLLSAAAASLVPLTAIAPPAGAIGPDCVGYDTILNGQYTLIPLKNQAMLTKERCGYRFRAGQQHSHLEVTESQGGLLFHDSGTASWKSVGAPCERVPVARGVAAWCPVPADTSPSNPMLLEIWPRLGDDYIDASSLPAKFQLAALVDAGRDTVYAGAGDDFVNGAFDVDEIHGGGGNDWLRSGDAADEVDGGPGADKIVTQGGADVVSGGTGRDSIYAGSGADVVASGDTEYDLVNCGTGGDQLVSDGHDKRRSCERVTGYVPGGESSGGTQTGGEGTSGTTDGQTGNGGNGSWGSGEIVYGDATTALPKQAGKTPGIGPSSPYVQQIMIDDVVPLKDQAIINPVPNGYLFRAGQQDSDLTMAVVNGRLQFVDEGTAAWKWLPPECRGIEVARGVGASCVIPSFFDESNAMLIEVWPRLGHDIVDSTALSAAFDVSFLADVGQDKAYFGAGDDFFNGAQDDDTGYGGAGRDWLRTGDGNDLLDGQAGGDSLVGVNHNDTIYGGAGDDVLSGGAGDDTLHAGSGNDRNSCGTGFDIAWMLRTDKAYDCETVNLS